MLVLSPTQKTQQNYHELSNKYIWKDIFKPLGKGLPIEIRVRHVLSTISLIMTEDINYPMIGP